MKKQMTSKERVLTAIAHQEPDRVPINLAGTNLDVDKRLKEHFGLAQDDHDGLLKALNVDFRMVDAPYTGPKIHADIENRHIETLWGEVCRWVANQSGGYWDFCDFPLKDAALEQVANWPMPDPDDFDYDFLLKRCQDNQQYCLLYGNPGLLDIMNSTGRLMSMEKVYLDLALDDEAWLCLVDRKVKVQMEIFERVLDKAADKIDVLWIGEDLGSQHAPMMSKDMFRKTIRPRHQKLIDMAKQHDLPVMIHSCGSSSWAFDDFAEMGINIVDTLQPEAKDMAPAYLKETYGDRLSFHGCISTAGPIAYGTVQETIDNVIETMEIMKPGGGYLLSPTHSLQDNSPTENVIAAYEAALKYGTY